MATVSPGPPLKEGFSGYRLPSLIKQLQSILRDYPADGQILKELIQNAEDADAKTVKFLYNGAHVTPDTECNDIPHLKALKAPGLCVYNDAVFSEQDWEGIRMLNSSVKENEPLKVGRFGLGFKSVFHLTDTPIIISGESIMFIDPHMYEDDPRKVCYTRCLKNIDEFKKPLLAILDGTFGFTEASITSGSYKGTLFWFPLRPQQNDLADTYTEENIKELFTAFREEASHMMLFLKSLLTIEVHQKNTRLFGAGEDSVSRLFTAEIQDWNGEDVDMKRQEFASSVRGVKGLPQEAIVSRYFMKVVTQDSMSTVDTVTKTTTWLVTQRYEGRDISKGFKKLCNDKDISSCPGVGLAVSLEQEVDGHIFCFLPLPLKDESPTGLPVHVHGHFAMEQNRRHLKWATADQKKNRAQTDKNIRWNQYLLTEVMPKAYVDLFSELVRYLESTDHTDDVIQRIYDLFPVTSKVTEHWNQLCELFYKQLFTTNFLFTPCGDGKWVDIDSALLLPASQLERSDVNSTLVYLFKTCKDNIVELPAHVNGALEMYHQDFENLRFVTENTVCEVLKRIDSQSILTYAQKLDLLEFACRSKRYECLNGVPLLPLSDGTFATFGEKDAVYVCDQKQDIKMFPGLENMFVQTEERTKTYLEDMATHEMYGLMMLSTDHFPILLKMCLANAFPDGRTELASGSAFDNEWISCIWQYITDKDIDVVGDLTGVALIPDDTNNLLHPVGLQFICMNVETVGHLDDNLGNALKHLGIIPLKKVPKVVSRNPNVLGQVIQYPSLEGLLKVLSYVIQNMSMEDMVTVFNCNASLEEKRSLIHVLKEASGIEGAVRDVLRKLELFSTTETGEDVLKMNIGQMSLIEPSECIPVSYPSTYLSGSSKASVQLAKLLGAKQIPEMAVVMDTLRLMQNDDKRYKTEDVKRFMMFLVTNRQQFLKEQNLLNLASSIRFLTTDKGSGVFRPKDLFEPTNYLKKLFQEENVFPAEEFQEPPVLLSLKLLGLLTEEDVKEEHICSVVEVIENLVDAGKEEKALDKSRCMLSFLKQNVKRLKVKKMKALRERNCIPCVTARPENFPPSLSFSGETTTSGLHRMGYVWCMKHLNIVGSVALVSHDISENVLKAFSILHEPPMEIVLDHLEETVKSYTEEYDDKFRPIIADIYKHLSKVKPKEVSQHVDRLRSLQYVFTSPEWGFQIPKNLWINKSKSDIDVKPYRFCLPKLWSPIADLVVATGGSKSQTHLMLVGVLQEIREKHDRAREIDLSDEMSADLNIVFQIINTLKYESKLPEGILLPVHTDAKRLVLRPIAECTYCNADWLKDQTLSDEDDEDPLYFVHGDISEDTAQRLEVVYLTERVMKGTESIDLNFGQREPLTQRLHNILKGYTPNSLTKEMIQNAEDAKASKVKILYDERQNNDARTFLMNEGMASLQGPALWFYNDAQFKPKDFENIQKLGGATKMEDESKIGRFGLGFNSVYNMTDVPSFISGNNIVIFDPHETYLGKPGLKADLTSIQNRRMLQSMKGQLKPFDGIFGFQMDPVVDEYICNGTLFRLPLRTPEQANKSKISEAFFLRPEMKRFLEDIARSAGNLLLFTHHVKSVEVYHLQTGDPKRNSKLLLTVKKKCKQQLSISPLTYLKNKSIEEQSTRGTVTENINVDLSTTEEFKGAFGVPIQQSCEQWQITWSLYDCVPEHLRKSPALKGLTPMSSSAIPLRQGVEIGDLDSCFSGFYKSGHLFSFLPLALPPTQFEFHINAQFALTDDRMHLSEETEEALSPGAWNTFLENEVISRMVADSLAGLGSVNKFDLDAYFKLWPVLESQKQINNPNCIMKPNVVTAFYRIITQGYHAIFPEIDSSNLVTFERVCFLDSDLAYDSEVGSTAVALFHSRWTDGIAVHLPMVIFQSFEKSGQQEAVKKHTVRKKDFYEKILLPVIGTNEVDQTDCEKLVLHALKQEDAELDALIRSHKCITVAQGESFKRPDELVNPNGTTAKLFSESDGMFPGNSFRDGQVIKRLCYLGMNDSEISWDILLDRVRSITDIHAESPMDARKRCLHIIQYVGEYDTASRAKRYETCPKLVKEQIQEMQFLPVLAKPKEWSFTWAKGDQATLSRPKYLFFKEVTELVGCSHPILDSRSLKNQILEMSVLLWLGVKGKEAVTAEMCKDQLLLISSELKPECRVTPNSMKTVHELYRHLDSLCAQNTEAQDVVATLSDSQVILHGNSLIWPHQVAFDVGFQLQPYLYELERTSRSLFKCFFETVGVRRRFTAERVKEEIDRVSALFDKVCMKDEEVRLYASMVNLWFQVSTVSTEDHIGDIKLPDHQMFLRKAETLCFNDCNWIAEDTDMQFVHPSITPEVASRLKVKSKRHASLQTMIRPLGIHQFGQNESLTRRLKNILEGYPRDSSIMKELLQNADDAGATELKFIKDFRYHPSERVLDEKWKALQGPALCIWNNTCFTEDNFEGIQSLGEGSKADDPLKTGQYGVGFNAVYHLTDVPSFLTFGPNTPKTLCVFDPNLKYVPWATVVSPGCRLETLAEFQHTYKDVFGCYLTDNLDVGKTGTIFRLPLRTKEMAEVSEISKEEVSVEGPKGIKVLLEGFKQEMTESLLFLQNVRQISIHNVTNDGRVEEEFKVTAEMTEECEKTIKRHRTEIHTKDKSNLIQQVINSGGVIKTTDTWSQKTWLVRHHSGFIDYNTVSDIIKDSIRNKKIGMLPRGGVAALLSKTDKLKGSVFCFLPLRIHSGLPVHINGHFALDHEARGNLWHGPHAYRTDWNETIIKQVVVPCYVETMLELRNIVFQSEMTLESVPEALTQYNRHFPMVDEGTDDYWKYLSECFYQHVLENRLKIFPCVMPVDGNFSSLPRNRTGKEVVNIKWVAASKEERSYFPIDRRWMTPEKKNVPLVEILKDIGMNVIDVPCVVHCQFQNSDIQTKIACLSPSEVTEFLKTLTSSGQSQMSKLPVPIDTTPIKTIDSLVLLTEFCMAGNDFASQLSHLPLLLTMKKDLTTFDAQSPVIVTERTSLVKGTPGRAMHPRLVHRYLKHLSETPVIKRLDIPTLTQILTETKFDLGKGRQVPWDRGTKTWIRDIWDFLMNEIERVTGCKIPDTQTLNKQLEALKNWCLLPVVVKSKKELLYYLYPLQDADKVLSFGMDVWTKHFTGTGVPELDTEVFGFNESIALPKLLTANLKNPISTLTAVAHSFKMGLIHANASINKIAEYFYTSVDHLKEDKTSRVTSLVRSLPIFEDVSGLLKNIEGVNVTGVIHFEGIPKDGLHIVFTSHETIFLKCTAKNRSFFDYLKIKIIQPSEFYSDIILKKLLMLSRDARLVHLTYVRDNLLTIVESLKHIPYIDGRAGSLCRASEFVSRDEPLFAMFCEESRFPPPPFDSHEWKTFLKTSGIVTNVSDTQFIQFAREIEKTGTVSKDSKIKSSRLVRHLFESRPDLLKGNLLSQIKGIRFVIPHDMERNTDQVDMARLIHSQFQHGKLVAYSGSLASEHCTHIWTTCAMFEDRSNPDYFKSMWRSKEERKKINAYLQIMEKPPIQALVDHVCTICNTMQQTSKEKLRNDTKLHSLLLKVMADLYSKILDRQTELDKHLKQKLQSVTLVFLPEEVMFVQTKQIVLELSAILNLKGFMYKAPVHFGPYHQLFLLLGGSKEVTADHCATWLRDMEERTKNTKLDPNELKQVSHIMKLLFKCFDEESDQKKIKLTLPSLYLLDREAKLGDSAQMTVSDNQVIEKRMESLKLRYFVGFQNADIRLDEDQDGVFQRLPSRYRPTILSEVTKETLSESCLQKAHTGPLAQRYKAHIGHSGFLEGVIRLVCDNRKLLKEKPFEQEKLSQIEEKIVKLELKEVVGLKNVLTFKGNVVAKSEESCPCFLEEDTNNIRIYIDASADKKPFKKKLLHFLARAIDKLTGDNITRLLHCLEAMLENAPGEIQGYLDEMKVGFTSYTSSVGVTTIFPDLGTHIDVEYHWMLDNSFVLFDDEEYVGLEIYDPLTDESLDGSPSSTQRDPVYIHARVVKRVDEGTSTIGARYLIDVGDAEPKEVSALDLYKFFRPEKSTSKELVLLTNSQANDSQPSGQNAESPPGRKRAAASTQGPLDMDQVLREIREVLKEAWKLPDKNQRDKVKKRLMFKWHPDKNPNNIDFCTKVFQKIQNYIERLERGQNIDADTEASRDAGSKTRSDFDEWFYEEMRRRSRRHHDFEDHWRRGSDDFSSGFSSGSRRHYGSSRSSTEKPHPQPEEARRWVRQARKDLKMAGLTLSSGEGGYNWSCYQSYMSCEKCVKALLYNKDGKKGNKNRTSNLDNLLYDVEDRGIRNMITDLLVIVKSVQKMQNPDKASWTIPSDVFTLANAQEARRLAEEVLQKTTDIIG